MVEAVQANYRAMRSVPVAAALLKEVPEWPSLAAQERVVAAVLDDPVVTAYAPAPSYTRAFLRALIADVEGAGAEVAEELYSRYVELCVAPGSDSAAPTAALAHCTLTHHGSARSTVPAPDALPLRLSRALNPVGLTTWPAGYFLTELLLDQHGESVFFFPSSFSWMLFLTGFCLFEHLQNALTTRWCWSLVLAWASQGSPSPSGHVQHTWP